MKMAELKKKGTESENAEKSAVASVSKSNVAVAELLKVGAVLAMFGVLYLMSRYMSSVIDVKAVQTFVKQAGPLAPLLYMSCYLVGPTVFFPASLLSMTGGALFGPFWGSLYTICSATLGATVPFLVTRRYGRKPLEKLLSKSQNFEEQFEVFEQSVAEQGWKYVAFTRLVTVFPFLLLNYAFGLTKVSLWTYVWSSFLFMLPGTFMFNYMGYAGSEALTGGSGLATKIIIAVGCFILLSALPGLVKRFKEKRGDK